MKYLTALMISICFASLVEVILYTMDFSQGNIYRWLGILGLSFGFSLMVLLQGGSDE